MKVATVTDAASGIGLALTKQLLQEGLQVDAIIRSRMPDTPNVRNETNDGRLTVYNSDLADDASRHDIESMHGSTMLESALAEWSIHPCDEGAIWFVKKHSSSMLEHPENFEVLFGPYATSKLVLTLGSQAIPPNASQQTGNDRFG